MNAMEIVIDHHSYIVHLEVQFTDEPYRSHTQAREFVPLTVSGGIRTQVVAHFSIAMSADGKTGRKQYYRIGEGYAWFYHEDRLLLLWRCNLLERYRVGNPTEDRNLHILWQGFERFLLDHFPETLQIITPSWNRPYNESLWLQFIQRQGFIQPSPTGIRGAAFIKGAHVSSQEA